MNYINEFDPLDVEWLRELIREGFLPGGDVDGRSIKEVQAKDLAGYGQCHFFGGIGGWPVALRLAGWPSTRPVWTGSCPCQPYSSAGKGKGDEDPRNLWPDFFRLIREHRPDCVFGEQVENAVRHGWLDGISADLEGEGYAVGSAVLGAHSVGSPHIRQRLYWVAHTGQQPSRVIVSRGCFGDSDGAPLRRPETLGEPRRCGRSDGMADAVGERFGPGSGGPANTQGERVRGIEPDTDCELRGLGDANGTGSLTRRSAAEADRHGRSVIANGNAGGLGDATESNERRAWESSQVLRRAGEIGGSGAGGDAVRVADSKFLGQQEHERRPGTGEESDPSHSGRASSFWDRFDLVPCRDGKTRRIEPGSAPLAHGFPRQLGPLLAVLERMGIDPKRAKRAVRNARGRLAKAGRNRVGRLRGYGNALCIETAVIFVRAFMETEQSNQGVME